MQVDEAGKQRAGKADQLAWAGEPVGRCHRRDPITPDRDRVVLEHSRAVEHLIRGDDVPVAESSPYGLARGRPSMRLACSHVGSSFPGRVVVRERYEPRVPGASPVGGHAGWSLPWLARHESGAVFCITDVAGEIVAVSRRLFSLTGSPGLFRDGAALHPRVLASIECVAEAFDAHRAARTDSFCLCYLLQRRARGAMGANRPRSPSRQAPCDPPASQSLTGNRGHRPYWPSPPDRLVLPAAGGTDSGRIWCSSQAAERCGCKQQLDPLVQETGRCWQLAQYLVADVGAGVSQGPREAASSQIRRRPGRRAVWRPRSSQRGAFGAHAHAWTYPKRGARMSIPPRPAGSAVPCWLARSPCWPSGRPGASPRHSPPAADTGSTRSPSTPPTPNAPLRADPPPPSCQGWAPKISTWHGHIQVTLTAAPAHTVSRRTRVRAARTRDRSTLR